MRRYDIQYEIIKLMTYALTQSKKNSTHLFQGSCCFLTNQLIMKNPFGLLNADIEHVRVCYAWASFTNSPWFLKTNSSLNESSKMMLSVVILPESSSLLNSFKTSFCITRFTGRAPYSGL